MNFNGYKITCFFEYAHGEFILNASTGAIF